MNTTLHPSPVAVLANLYNDILAITYFLAGSPDRGLYFELINQLHLAGGCANHLLCLTSAESEFPYSAWPPKQIVHNRQEVYPQLARMTHTFNNLVGILPVKSQGELLMRMEVYHHLIRAVEITNNLNAQEN